MEVSTLRKNELSSIVPNFDWKEFDEASPVYFHEAQPALITFYAVLWLTGILGNIWVAVMVGYLLIKQRSRRSSDAPLTVQIYIFSLCLFDLLVLAFLPLLLLDLIYGSWRIPSSSLCKFYLLSEGFNKFGSIWILTALSGFCYSNIRRMTKLESRNGSESSTSTADRKISSELTSATFRTCRKLSPSILSKRHSTASVIHNPIREDNGRKSAFTVLACAVAVLVAMSPVFFYADVYYVVVHNETVVQLLALKCAFQPPHTILTTFTIYSFSAGYLCPVILFTYYYSAILIYVRRHRRSLVHNSAVGGGRSRRRYCRVARTAVGLVLWSLLTWSPFWIIFLYFYLNPQTDTETTANASATIILSYFVHSLPYINSTAVPVLLIFLNKNLRIAYARTKMAAMNRRRRMRFSSIGGGGTTTTSSCGGGSDRRPTIRSSYDYSTCDNEPRVSGERTISVQIDDTSLTFFHFEEFDKNILASPETK